ncbi:hypothetical protein PO124_05995 [Bacillus licheniformis]|nr:hypothetical protein [Bacillus licheniformis]
MQHGNGWLPGKFHEWVQMGHRAAALLLFAWIIAAAVHAARQYKIKTHLLGLDDFPVPDHPSGCLRNCGCLQQTGFGFALAHAFFISCLFGILCYFLLLVARYRRQVQNKING